MNTLTMIDGGLRLLVRLNVFSILRKTLGAKSLSIELPEGSTLKDLLLDLEEKYGDDFQRKTGKRLFDRVANNFNVFLNNRQMNLSSQLNKALKEGDEITILQPSGGG